MQIETETGRKLIKFLRIPAMEGWEIQYSLATFLNSSDPKTRRDYVMRILGYARVMVGSNELPLSTGALIDNHLCSADNVKAVFEGALAFNGISANACAKNKSDFKTSISNDIATSFVAGCMGALQLFVLRLSGE